MRPLGAFQSWQIIVLICHTENWILRFDIIAQIIINSVDQSFNGSAYLQLNIHGPFQTFLHLGKLLSLFVTQK